MATDAADDVFRGVTLGFGEDVGPGGILKFFGEVDLAFAFSRAGGPLLVNEDFVLGDAVEEAAGKASTRGSRSVIKGLDFIGVLPQGERK